MKFALEAIRNGSKIKTATKKFNEPESTIRVRLKLGENYDPPGQETHIFKGRRERKRLIYHFNSKEVLWDNTATVAVGACL